MKKVTITISSLLVVMMSYGQTNCKSKTKNNIQCKNITQKTNSLCHTHDKNHKVKSTIPTIVCKGITKKNTKCKNKIKNTSGLCHNHNKKK